MIIFEWYDDDAKGRLIEDIFVEWYEGYKKCKAQKGSIKDKLLPIAWHPSRHWDWCMPEVEKQETEKLWG